MANLNNRKSYSGLIFSFKIYLTVVLSLLSSYALSVQTSNSNELTTWWHSNYELNDNSPVADVNVRRSTIYDVSVSTVTAENSLYDSYAYMSIPRGGRDKWLYTDADGAEFSDIANLTMSWSSFIYNQDVWVQVSLRNGHTISSADQVKLKPSVLNFEKQMVNDHTVRIKVPYSSKGYRFSVEFDSELYTAYNDMSGITGNLTTIASGNKEVHTEPKNALMIFAEPRLTGANAERLIPSSSSGSIYYPAQGDISNLNNTTAQIIYFQPGTYYMPWNYHAKLPASVKWIYFAPGAYVKGAFQFMYDNEGVYKVTGFGVLSGEKYVYEPDTANNYMHRISSNCHNTCVKMLQFKSSFMQQYLDLHGVTIAEPPYHSFVTYGYEDNFHMRVENYKQVGSWYWQTDGLELYSNGTLNNSFFHSNDDVIKLYHNNIAIDNTVIWKGENGPVLQWGWAPRDLENVSVTNTYVIHNRMYWKDKKSNTCIINSAGAWQDTNSTTLGDSKTWVKNITIENLYVDGKTNCAMRIYALSNTENITFKNFNIGGWSDLGADGTVSEFKRYGDTSQLVEIGNQTQNNLGLKLENYSVSGQLINRNANNWQSDQLGKLNFDIGLWDNWNAWQTGCTSQQLNLTAIDHQLFNTSLTLNANVDTGLPISYTIFSGPASLNNSQLTTGTTTGKVTVAATQAGNSVYCPKTTTQRFNVRVANSLWVAGNFSSWGLMAMSQQKGNFHFTLPLTPGSYQMKFANTANWSGKDWGSATGTTGTTSETTGGGSNISFAVSQAGDYRIEFDPVTLIYSVTYVRPTPSALWVAGSYNNWNPQAMTYIDGKMEITQYFAAGSYDMKFADTNNWTGNDWGNEIGLVGTASPTTGGLPPIKFIAPDSRVYHISVDPVGMNYFIY